MCMSNHFIIDKEALCDPLSQIFTAMLCHGIIPDSIRDCILVPIPKLGKDPDSYVFFFVVFFYDIHKFASMQDTEDSYHS